MSTTLEGPPRAESKSANRPVEYTFPDNVIWDWMLDHDREAFMHVRATADRMYDAAQFEQESLGRECRYPGDSPGVSWARCVDDAVAQTLAMLSDDERQNLLRTFERTMVEDAVEAGWDPWEVNALRTSFRPYECKYERKQAGYERGA